MTIRIGTRGSKLARWQAEWVASQLAKSGVATELVYLKTLGDVTTGPIGKDAQGVFTKEIQRALLDNLVDLAVHSLKDLPTDVVEGLELAAVPRRESCGDALVAKVVGSIEELPQGATVATGSARRRAQLLAHRPDLVVPGLRGNVDTRLRKLNEEQLDAIVLAEAGLLRLGLDHHITQPLPKEIMLPAVGQGALGLETRIDDEVTRLAIGILDDAITHQAVLAERALLRSLRGGCLAPIGAWARLADETTEQEDSLRLDAVVLSPDGQRRLNVSASATVNEGEQLGVQAAELLRSKGADQLLEAARQAGEE